MTLVGGSALPYEYGTSASVRGKYAVRRTMELSHDVPYVELNREIQYVFQHHQSSSCEHGTLPYGMLRGACQPSGGRTVYGALLCSLLSTVPSCILVVAVQMHNFHNWQYCNQHSWINTPILTHLAPVSYSQRQKKRAKLVRRAGAQPRTDTPQTLCEPNERSPGALERRMGHTATRN